MGAMDWDPVNKDGGRPAHRANKLLRAVQAAVAAHDAESGAAPAEVLETRVEIAGPEAVRVHRRCRAADGTEQREIVQVAFDRDADRWQVTAVDPGGA